MKKKTISGIALVLGGCLWTAFSGYGGDGHDHSHDHVEKAPAGVEIANPARDFILTDQLKTKLELKIGTAEMPDIPGADDEWIAVPLDALANLSADGKKATVYFTEDSGTDGTDQKFTASEVELGKTNAGYVEVITGLFPGDTVIIKNASRIGEVGASQTTANQGKTTKENTIDVPTPKPNTKVPLETMTVQVDRANPSARISKDVSGAKDPAVCDFRRPLKDGDSRSLCPEKVRSTCDELADYQDLGQCYLDANREKNTRTRRSYHSREPCHW